jgi:TonB family protein
VQIKNSISPLIDTEALRIFNLLQWIPAMKDGKTVTSRWSTTFNFEPGKYSKLCKNRGYDHFTYISEVDTSGKIVKQPDQNPMYPDGLFAVKDFIRKNLEYPRQAQLGNIQGVVMLRFVVEPSGLMTNIGVKKSVGAGCDEEAIRVLQLIKWYPGKKIISWYEYK